VNHWFKRSTRGKETYVIRDDAAADNDDNNFTTLSERNLP
jgi:hypothetical protein